MKQCVALLVCIVVVAACQEPGNGSQVSSPAARPTQVPVRPSSIPTMIASATLAPPVVPSPTPVPTLAPLSAKGHIAFLTLISDTQELATINPDGSGYTVITHDLGGNVTAFAYTPNRLQIAVTVKMHVTADSNLYLVDADGSNVRPLATSTRSEFGATWSPDGTQLLFIVTTGEDCTQTCNEDIFRINANGDDLRQLTVDPLPDVNPAWSPDGAHIIFARGCQLVTLIDYPCDLYTMAADGTEQTRTDSAVWPNSGPNWTWPTPPDNTWQANGVLAPDNVQIIFEVQVGTCSQGGTCSRQVYTARVGGLAPVQVTNAGTWNALPAWSPDSRQVVFVSERDSDSALYLMNANGSNQHRLVQVVSNYPVPRWIGAPAIAPR